MPDVPRNYAAAEPYVTAFDTTVRSVDGRDVTLAETHFYAEGGGQPADRGALGGHEVVDVQTRDGETVHTLAAEPAFEAGETVVGAVDDEFRTYCMRAHTASHIVYGAGRRLFGPDGYGGFDIGEEVVRLDFTTDVDADAVDPLEVQRLANEAVWHDRSVEWYEMDLEEARRDEDIVFNLRDAADPTEAVRIVEIDGWDVSACGGTHVASTGEVGPVEVLSISNPGAGLVRVEYAVGPTAIQCQVEQRRAATEAAETLDTGIEGLPERAEALVSENEALRAELADLRESMLDSRIDSIAADALARDGSEWAVGTVEGIGPNTVADQLRDRNTDADVTALVGRDGPTFVVVRTDGETDATDVVGDVTDEFGGGGGGQPTLAQGGGVDADPETVVDYLRSE